ncbi:C-X-C chemokine receptor type 6-like [Rhineura floridana]|uniref:C-X-C chemokine receptor type 6-like n=1 Tax=Rhineura floridana TaxID=261503 RepID=UPI002AC7F540|nr:C-X-C chemokine receptor type 6-like [Rhineura floridana]
MLGENAVVGYVTALQSVLHDLHRYSREFQRLPVEGPIHSHQPGDWVRIRKWQKGSLKDTWSDPKLILLSTHAAVKLNRVSRWIHVSRLKAASPPVEPVKEVAKDLPTAEGQTKSLEDKGLPEALLGLGLKEYLNTTSHGENGHETFSVFSRVFLVSMYSFACILGVSGNALVLIILTFYEKIKVLTDIFLVSLAIADLCFLCTLPFWAYSAAWEWIFYTLPCQIIQGLYTLNLYGSMLTLTCITIDRYFSIVHATKVHTSQAKRIVWGKVVCILVWMISLTFALPQFLFSMQAEADKKVCIAKYSTRFLELFTEVIQIVLGFFLPMLVMVICYSMIMKTLFDARGFRKHKSLKIIFVIVVMFIFTQTPLNLLKLIRTVYQSVILDEGFDYALIITEAIAYFHSCLNPVLYFYIGVKFRQNLAKKFKSIGGVKPQQIVMKQTTEDNAAISRLTSEQQIESPIP